MSDFSSMIKIKRLIISTRKGFIVDGLRKCDCIVLDPYVSKTIAGRVLREISFKIGLFESIWYSKKCLEYDPEHIEVHDPLITIKYLKWLQKSFQARKLNIHMAI